MPKIISQRYERGSIIITSNLPFDEWTEVFGSERLTGAILDRLTHHVHMPKQMKRLSDVLGQIDGVGRLNSRLSINTDIPVHIVWHHTNTELPCHLPVTKTMISILEEESAELSD